jgi:predicted DNA-binding transcriptional regulator AlpA
MVRQQRQLEALNGYRIITQGQPLMSEVLTAPQAADFLKLSVSTINKLRTYGGGPKFIKLGSRRIGYLKSDLLEWLQSCSRCASTSDPTAAQGQRLRPSEPRRGRDRKLAAAAVAATP